MNRPTLDQALQVARDLGACGRCSGRGTVDAPHCHGRSCEGSAWPERTPGPRVCTCECSMCDPLCRTCGTTGVVGELSPAVVTWLARLALHHQQVSAAVAAALPSSGVRWGMPWTESDDGDATDVRAGVAGGRDLGRVTAGGLADWAWVTMGVHGRSGSRDAARAEVDERLIAAGYTLLGEVYRRATVEPEPVDEMWEAAARRREARRLLAGPPVDPAEEPDDTCATAPACDGTGVVPRD